MHKGPVIECAGCGGAIVAPEWSEHRSERCVRNVWSCEACGYRFEHTVYFSAPKIQPLAGPNATTPTSSFASG
jgi:ribosomal protein L37AE/L43A